MKKLLSIIIASTMFTILIINTNAVAPAGIIIYNEEELSEMREMLNASDEELAEFLSRTGHIWNGMSRREHIVMFLEYIDSLPVPYIEGTRFSGLSHYFISQRTFISFSTNVDETYSFRFIPNDENLNRVPLLKLNLNGGRSINVYSTPESEFNEHGAIFYLMEIDGFTVRAGYNRGRDNEHITTFNPQEAYKDMIITSFAEAPWSTISPAVVEELIVEEPLTTADALAVLRAVSGLTALTDEQSARLGISGAPSTGDAMRLLRVVAGL
ncbi:MAG: hypothetical protein LBC86_05685 [Oscillospiraceae bacterium]|jgi:hypothetical protein|nr:hypothetical protein [Oscillospiraceae bacterium]